MVARSKLKLWLPACIVMMLSPHSAWEKVLSYLRKKSSSTTTGAACSTWGQKSGQVTQKQRLPQLQKVHSIQN